MARHKDKEFKDFMISERKNRFWLDKRSCLVNAKAGKRLWAKKKRTWKILT